MGAPDVGAVMVSVAQSVELRIVIPAVAGSNPVVHPIPSKNISTPLFSSCISPAINHTQPAAITSVSKVFEI